MKHSTKRVCRIGSFAFEIQGPLLFQDRLTCESERRSRTEKQKSIATASLTLPVTAERQRTRARQSRVEKLSAVPDNSPVSRWARFCIGKYRDLSGSNARKRLITAHYFTDILSLVLHEYNSKVICKVQQRSTLLSIPFKESETSGRLQPRSVRFIWINGWEVHGCITACKAWLLIRKACSLIREPLALLCVCVSWGGGPVCLWDNLFDQKVRDMRKKWGVSVWKPPKVEFSSNNRSLPGGQLVPASRR